MQRVGELFRRQGVEPAAGSAVGMKIDRIG